MNPKSLPCLHSFCLTCLDSQTKKSIGFFFPFFSCLLSKRLLYFLHFSQSSLSMWCVHFCSACDLVDFNHSRQSSLLAAWCPRGRLCLIQTMSSVSFARKGNLPPPTAQSVQAFCAPNAHCFMEGCLPPSTTKLPQLMWPSLARAPPQLKGFLDAPSIL